MTIAEYSHAFFVGSFNGYVKPQDLKDGWQRKRLSAADYNYRLTMYYKSHIDAMAEAETPNRPDFLKDVCHYQYTYQIIEKDEHEHDKITKKGEEVAISFEKDKKMITYPFYLCNIDLYFFPFDIVLVSIEIEEKEGSDLDLLTFAHSKLVDWEKNINKIANNAFKEYLKPLAKLLPDENLSSLIKDGNNLKAFQIVQCEEEEPSCERLFEIATFSPVPSVKGRTENSHSEAYYAKLMNENSVSTYFNWKALALVDSFTVLGGKDFENKIWQWINLYYPLVYLRCIFEKTFCFSRNNTYRLGDKQTTVKKLSEDIMNMEKYYFYGNFSYNFQPNLVYEAMVKGLDIKTEHEELSKQIKDRAKEEEEKRQNRITLGLSVFAVFSVAWDLCSIFTAAFTEKENRLPAQSLFILSFVAILLLVFQIYRPKK